jgi:hypothetical protein
VQIAAEFNLADFYKNIRPFAFIAGYSSRSSIPKTPPISKPPRSWPKSMTRSKPAAEQKAAVEKAAQAVLDARAQFPGSTLADLYDPVAMPPSLGKAHTELDRAVDRGYRREPFPSDRARVEYLFKLYEQLTAPLLPATKPKRTRKSS